MTMQLHSRRFAAALSSLAAATVFVFLSACEMTPTGRRQLQLFPSEQLSEMGQTAFAQIKKETPVLNTSQPVSRYIECVSDAVTAAVGGPVGGGKWNVSVFRGDQVNAFALPGGNIGVYTGLLKAATTPDQLAAVIGHEVAHVQAEHPNARLSAQYATDAGLSLIQVLAQGTRFEGQQVMALLGVGGQVGVMLPFSRSQESEADILGLRYMAQAGFDPRAAVTLWQNMGKVGGGGGPAFLSTHPSGEQRIEILQKNMPQAMTLYQQAQSRRPGCAAVTP